MSESTEEKVEEKEEENTEALKEVILVAEDSPPNRAILVHLLKKLEFNVIDCEDGEIAWTKTQELLKDGIKPIAILSDIMMPKMDGISFLKEIRGNEELKDTPFVLVTAMNDKEHVLEAKQLGVDGYIVKPVSFQGVLNKLKEIFPDRKFPNLAA